MKRMVRWLLVIGVLLGGIGGRPQATQAAGLCSTSPSSQNCNGQDPYEVGCWSDKRAVVSRNIYGGQTYKLFGKVTLYYSPRCKSNFSYVERLTSNPAYTEAFVAYEFGNFYFETVDSGHTRYRWSGMIYAPTGGPLKVGACGSVTVDGETGSMCTPNY